MTEMKNVWKQYFVYNKVLPVLKNINLTIRPQEFIAISGPSGSGKSTLMNLLGGLDKPDQGEILYDGKDIARLSDREMAAFRNKKIGFVFQKHNLQGNLTAVENVELPMFYAKTPPIVRRRAAIEALREVGLSDRMRHLPCQLSGGQCQRVSIARAIIMKPDIILADEPTGSLDPENEKKIVRYLKEMNEKGFTVIIVTHNREVAKEARRNIVIDNGEVVSDLQF